MKNVFISFMKPVYTIQFSMVCMLLITIQGYAQVPDPNQGLRAAWMRGALGMLWLPERTFNGNIEGIRIDNFLTQIKDIRTVDYIQIPLTSPNIFSPTHVAPHPIIESLWRGDTDSNGKPRNLVVPRASVDDPFLSWLKALRAAGLKTEVYVNSYNLLARVEGTSQPDFPDVSTRWMEWCDTNAEAQAFINSKSYHNGPGRRKYMFCYAEFILKEYAERYGDLIDAWCFDSADNIMANECGDDPASENLEHQRIYQAFANAVHAGNPNAAVAFNNSVGERLGNPFTTATYFDDYTFGHPFGGAGNMVENATLYNYNHHVVEFMQTNNGYAFRDDTRNWNNNVVAHFFPKQSTTSWNAGNTPCLTDEQFVEWNATGIINGGAITWGTPLVRTNLENSPVLTLQPYALTQLSKTDTYFKQYQSPGAPNWSRQYTILSEAHIGKLYSFNLIEGTDIWDPEGDAITSIVAQGSFPSWLTIAKTSPGVWTLSGTPTETADTNYEFSLRVSDASGGNNRTVKLKVIKDVVPEPTKIDVQIKAAANTNYGINQITTMYSEVQTAPDGKATYRLAIEVTPPLGKAVISGISGGPSTETSWGLGDGFNSNNDDIFNGNENEWVQSIKNIKIIDFNANGGTLTANDFSPYFKAITIENGQSTNDNVSLSIGTTTANPGKMGSQTQVLDLALIFGSQNITDFAIGVGNASDTNKWSVQGITVEVTYDGTILANAQFNKNEVQGLLLFPNPTDGFITINKLIHAVQIIDMSGQVVKMYATETDTLDVSDLKTGIYLLKGINNEENIVVKTFIKK
ncbi:T9SS type A sorting domain-containing protein [Flavobacterium sp. NG2]|uniref:T9SS type A sorting domain-containing protein n=1 Tax=Flavobacterium sp. NG2 TaxID=3097547 RepID=UPI002A814F7E|nr:T9SS type A sorting domain-containing protein [Flavobacterium sp. NG2]WPR73176.1 T9SS type A sorting domain-containing protein [Flavobacterium sp. NG2]